MHFRYLLEGYGIGKLFFDAINRCLERAGRMIRGGNIVDAMLISAPKSTKNAEKKWAPEMHHTQKRESVAFRYEVPYRYGRGQRICPYSGSITAIISVGSFAVLSIIPIISFRVCKNQRMHFIPGKVLVQHGYLSFCCNRLLFMGSSLSPIMVDGVTHHHQDRLSPLAADGSL